MADRTPKEATISVKVIVDKVKKRVVYAEADHTFVDILFSFMTLPMGTIARLLAELDDKKFEALGSLNNLYQSLKDFPECYLATKECKSLLLNPRSLSYDHCRNLKLKLDDTEPMQYYVCKNRRCMSFCKFYHDNKVSDKDCTSTKCSSCWKVMGLEVVYWYSDVSVGGGVFVSDISTFIITDDLCVEPYTSASSIRLLADFGITDMNHLEERNLEMSSYLMLYFLKIALSIDCPFTYLAFSKIKYPIREIIGSGQDNSTFDHGDLFKQEASASSKMLVEVSLQKSTGKLLYAEAKEDFVEFLFGFLSIPLGTVIGTLMNGASSMGCMDNLFKSISKMSVGRYLKSQAIKDMLLQPHIGQQYPSKNWIFPLKGAPKRFSESEHKDPRIDGKLLKQSGLFMVTDDLIITPSSTLSTVNTLKKLKVSPKDIESYYDGIGLNEGLSVLKASLRSCSTLSDSLEHQVNK